MSKLITASFKQRKFVHQLLQHGNRAKAYREVYQDAGNFNSERGKEVLMHPMTQQYIRRIMDEAGVTDEKIGKALHTIMEASLTKESLRMSTPAHGLKAIEIAAKLKDLNPAEKKQIDKRTMNLSLEGKSMDELKTMLETLVDEANSFKRMVNKDAEVLSKLQ
jgi:hypothetical protein